MHLKPCLIFEYLKKKNNKFQTVDVQVQDVTAMKLVNSFVSIVTFDVQETY